MGLCGVIAAKRLGAEQIIILGRHADRIALAKDFGATDVVSERGDAAVEGRHAVDLAVAEKLVLDLHTAESSSALAFERVAKA